METIRLCSNYDPVTGMVCDLPAKHRGAHRATCYWGDEIEVTDDNDD
jgi:hypothetical protein